MGALVHLIVIEKHPQWFHNPIRNIQWVLYVVLHLMLVLVMVKVVWDLGPTTLPPKKLIVGLMVEILWDLRVGNIHTWVIYTNKGPILHHIFGGKTTILRMVMVEVLLVLGQPTYPPQNIILAEAGRMGIFRNLSVSTQNPPWRYFGVWIVPLVILIVLCLVLMMDTVMWCGS